MLKLPRPIVLFDLEATTWEGAAARNWSGPGEHREVIQCGAVVLDTTNFTELASFKQLVKPSINPVLSQYCVDLTHITQEALDLGGISFLHFFEMFFRFCQRFELYCFDSRVDGSRLFDRDVLEENCALLGHHLPLRRDRFHNINEIFHEHGVTVKQSGAAPEAFGIKLPARPHDALNDVRGLVIGLRALSERLKESKEP